MKKGFAIVLVCMLLSLSVIPGCAPQEKVTPAPPKVVKPASVSLGLFTDMSGPLRAQAGPARQIINMCWKYVNEVEGGIDGVPINVIEADTATDVKKMRSAYEQYKNEVVTMTAPGQSGFYDALLKNFAEDKMPVYLNVGGSDGFLYPPTGWTFGCLNTADTFGFYGQWAMKNWKESRKPRVAMLLGDYPGGRFPLFCKPYLENLGMEVVATEILPLRLASSMDQMLRIKDAKPDFVFTTIIVTQLVVVLEDLRNLGVKLGPTNQGNDFELFYSYGLGPNELGMFRPENYEGILIHNIECDVRFYGDPNFTDYTKLLDKYMSHFKVTKETFSSAGGITTGLIMVEAVKRAVEKVGWEKLTSEAVGLYGYPGIKNWNSIVAGKITITKDDPRVSGGILCRLHKDGSYEFQIKEFTERPWVFKWLDEHGFEIYRQK